MTILNTLNTLPFDQGQKIVSSWDYNTLLNNYLDVVDFKNKYLRAYQLIDSEMNKRTSYQIEMGDSEHCAALAKENVVVQEDKLWCVSLKT